MSKDSHFSLWAHGLMGKVPIVLCSQFSEHHIVQLSAPYDHNCGDTPQTTMICDSFSCLC